MNQSFDYVINEDEIPRLVPIPIDDERLPRLHPMQERTHHGGFTLDGLPGTIDIEHPEHHGL